MKQIRKYLFAVISAFTVAALGTGYFYTYSCIPQKAVEIVNSSGDRSVLDDIKISGVIADELHKQEFTITGNSVSCNFQASSRDFTSKFAEVLPGNMPINLRSNIQIPDDAKTSRSTSENQDGSITTSVTANKADLYYIIYKDRITFSFKTDVIYNSDSMGVEISSTTKNNKLITTSQNSGGGDIGIPCEMVYLVRTSETGRVFAFTSTGKNCSGFGGAYEITDYLKSSDKALKNVKDPATIDVPNIAPIDLKNGAVRIFNMEVLSNQLVFFTEENSQVVLKVFDLNTNQFLDDINLGYQKSLANIKYTDSIKYHTEVDGDMLYFALNIYDESTANSISKINNLFAVYDGQKKQLVFQCNGSFSLSNVNINQSDVVMKYKDGRLYVVRKYNSYDLQKNKNYNAAASQNAEISVYGDHGLLYEGLFQSDVKDDRLFQGQRDSLSNQIYFRNYYGLKLE